MLKRKKEKKRKELKTVKIQQRNNSRINQETRKAAEEKPVTESKDKKTKKADNAEATP